MALFRAPRTFPRQDWVLGASGNRMLPWVTPGYTCSSVGTPACRSLRAYSILSSTNKSNAPTQINVGGRHSRLVARAGEAYGDTSRAPGLCPKRHSHPKALSACDHTYSPVNGLGSGENDVRSSSMG